MSIKLQSDVLLFHHADVSTADIDTGQFAMEKDCKPVCDTKLFFERDNWS